MGVAPSRVPPVQMKNLRPERRIFVNGRQVNHGIAKTRTRTFLLRGPKLHQARNSRKPYQETRISVQLCHDTNLTCLSLGLGFPI